ncbi:hypothetical protein B0186_05165 [Canicola haemoglobinophilus]|uniref:Type II secretory pathway, pseudopilin n=1 Tax=Canicola haemoglobinophilus TaxID=733 RepID=A0A1V4B1H2_9PAST|nr:DUF2572 family protein [Canicola haemoglobinophilus]OOS00970.1 hypothetical protein B0186_05165 [Canicola haemoglobinophilus]STO54877.1 Putative type II secretory pathway, pseudopilin [Canicola haemoglobinophilus]STO59147.1 Putative type II secretory pathway, pseudopilin [Canicola haemoglobinophilus]STO69552.1 Putative type II secretory pathway, pseudopilin [Canicola haemoglobinophilus]
MRVKKGIVTLTLLMLLSSVLLVLLLFDNDLLSLHSSIVAQRKHYLTQSLILQKKSQESKESICKQQSLDNDLKSINIVFENGQKIDRTSQFIWCERKSLFKRQPRKSFHVMGLNEYLNMDEFEFFQNKLTLPSSPLPKDKSNYLYWFDDDMAEWELNGNINAIILAKGHLKLKGKGKISGAVITGGKLMVEPSITITYRSVTVRELVRSYSYWQVAEKSWYDFNPLQ